MNKKVWILVLIVLICTVLSAKDTEWINWGRAGEFTVGFSLSLFSPFLGASADGVNGFPWIIAPLVNYGYELGRAIPDDKNLDWRGCVVRTIGMAIPALIFWVPYGMFSSIEWGLGDQDETIYSKIDLPRPSEPFKLRGFGDQTGT